MTKSASARAPRYRQGWVRGAALLIMVVLIVLGVNQWARADAALTTSYTAQGTYGMVAGGIGLFTVEDPPFPDSGDLVFTVPAGATSIVQAYLYWAGNDVMTGGDDTVDFGVDGGATTSLTADQTYGPDFWFNDPPDLYHFVYVEDVTAFIQLGTHTYNISGVGPIHNIYGAGLIVVYEDPALPVSQVVINDGLDAAYHNFPPPQGPNTEVSCHQFMAEGAARPMDFFVVGGGISDPDRRPNSIWHLTGTSALGNIIDAPGAIEIPNFPLNDVDGPEWDTFQASLTVPAGDTHACFQVESVNDQPPLNGASFLWLFSGSVIPISVTDTPTPTNTPVPPTPTDTPTPILPTVTPTATPVVTISATTTVTPVGGTSTPTPLPGGTPTDTPTVTPPGPTPTPVWPPSGFAQGQLTSLDAQPASKSYTAMGELVLEIPSLGVYIPILGVPYGDGTWDVSWLSTQAGYLANTAYPTWQGNTVLTGHVFLADGSPGPFHGLKTLAFGEKVILHAYGQRYIYEVQRASRVRPNDMSALGHEELDWVTLLTCDGYDPRQESYSWRLVVQAVLVEVVPDN